jgi:Mrp family chromosome partitioning ATPase
VAVTSCGKGVGVSSIATGLAASLSDAGDGKNVLLMDMNTEQRSSQQFYKGRPGCDLEESLDGETRNGPVVQSNLHVVKERLAGDEIMSLLPKQFTNPMPESRKSEFDYIIFDMPPVSQTSITPRLARTMDMLLFVLESEKTSQDVAKEALSLLADSKASVGAVLNKMRSYVPSRLHSELSDES